MILTHSHTHTHAHLRTNWLFCRNLQGACKYATFNAAAINSLQPPCCCIPKQWPPNTHSITYTHTQTHTGLHVCMLAYYIHAHTHTHTQANVCMARQLQACTHVLNFAALCAAHIAHTPRAQQQSQL